jgi:hypothetical protein
MGLALAIILAIAIAAATAAIIEAIFENVIIDIIGVVMALVAFAVVWNYGQLPDRLERIWQGHLVIEQVTIPQGIVGRAYTFTMTSHGGDQTHVTWSSSIPGPVDNIDFLDGVWSGTPTAATPPGGIPVTITVTDGVETTSRTFHVVVIQPAAAAPAPAPAPAPTTAPLPPVTCPDRVEVNADRSGRVIVGTTVDGAACAAKNYPGLIPPIPAPTKP